MSDVLAFVDEELVPAPADWQECFVDDDVPPAGTACQGCKLLGHFCAAKCYRGESSTLCLACANGVDCPVVRSKPKLESFFIAELEPARHDNPASPVRNVTPVDAAQRVVAPDPPMVRRNSNGLALGTDACGRESTEPLPTARVEKRPTERYIPAELDGLTFAESGNKITLRAKPAALLLPVSTDGPEVQKERDAPLTKVERVGKPMAYATMTEAIKDEIRRAPESENNSDLGRRLNVGNATVFYWRNKLKAAALKQSAKAARRAGQPVAKAKEPQVIEGSGAGVAGVSIDIVGVAERVHALGPVETATRASSEAITVSVTFTHAGVDAWWARLSLAEKVKVTTSNIVF